MPASIQGKIQPWFTPNENLSKSVTASTDIDVSAITAVFFTDASGTSVDVALTYGSFATPFPIDSGVALGIDSSTDTIQVDIDCVMHAMGGK